jgi:hypothetical protein
VGRIWRLWVSSATNTFLSLTPFWSLKKTNSASLEPECDQSIITKINNNFIGFQVQRSLPTIVMCKLKWF